MDLKLHLVNDLDLYLINNVYIFSMFCMMYSLLLIYTILYDLKMMF